MKLLFYILFSLICKIQIQISNESGKQLDNILKKYFTCILTIDHKYTCFYSTYVEEELVDENFRLCDGKIKVVKKNLNIPRIDFFLYECENEEYDIENIMERIHEKGFLVLETFLREGRRILKVKDSDGQYLMFDLSENNCMDSEKILISAVEINEDLRHYADKVQCKLLKKTSDKKKESPETPSPGQVSKTLGMIEKNLSKCIKKSKKKKKLMVQMEIEGETGKVSDVEIVNCKIKGKKFEKCVIETIKKANFGKFKKELYKLTYLFVIRN